MSRGVAEFKLPGSGPRQGERRVLLGAPGAMLIDAGSFLSKQLVISVFEVFKYPQTRLIEASSSENTRTVPTYLSNE